jgi:hypothetical protein
MLGNRRETWESTIRRLRKPLYKGKSVHRFCKFTAMWFASLSFKETERANEIADPESLFVNPNIILAKITQVSW